MEGKAGFSSSWVWWDPEDTQGLAASLPRGPREAEQGVLLPPAWLAALHQHFNLIIGIIIGF